MKNYRNGVEDVSPPLHHANTRPCFTKISIGGLAIMIGPGPVAVPFPTIPVHRLPASWRML